MLTFLEEAREIEPQIIAIRRKIHSDPELSFKELKTAKLVASELRKLGIKVQTYVGGNGVLGTLVGEKGGKVVALRADMDALPVTEDVDLPFKSRNKGVMHACGHDTHTAMLLGAAVLLSRHKKDLHGTVKFLFQPAEEDGGIGGAKPMIRAGVMKNPKVDYVFGLHIWGEQSSGTFGVRPGAFMATPDGFEIRILGRGGHGSRPDETVDPIFIAAQLINSLQAVSSRLLSPTEPFVLSVCSIHSGTTDNVIPDDAYLMGTMRTLDEKTRAQAKKFVTEITKDVCATFGAKCILDFVEDPYPITYNDENTTKKVIEILRKIKGTRTVEIEPRLGAEDFARFLQKAPGTFYYLGTKNPRKGCVYPNHSSKFKVDEDVLKLGTVSLATLAMEFAKT
ncbi:MAG: amidohydrolase [Nitrososphaerota archaeon]|nr:amidohydrolase [Nitrososphaerota archaeon]MDG6922750.1 amidohydrolase [Nitrososphaerota archaeon]